MQGTNTFSTAMKVIMSILVSNGLIEAALAGSVGAVVADRLIAIVKKDETPMDANSDGEDIAPID